MTQHSNGRWRMSRRSALLLPVAGIGAGLASPLRATAQEVIEATNNQATSTTASYFAQTGHNLKNPFLAVWAKAGGASTLGVPLSEERYDPGLGLAQSFEAMTLINDPTLDPPWDVQGQHLPADLVASIAPSSARRKVSGCDTTGSCRFFPERGHTISGKIREFWAEHGDLAIFGLPLSEPFRDEETGASTQVFERTVIENYGGGEIRLRPIGQLLTAANGLMGDPAFQPAPPTAGETKLVKAEDGLRLRSAPGLDSEIIVVLPDNAEYITAPGSRGDWVPGYADGYAGWVSADFLQAPPKLQTLSAAEWNPAIWQGGALGETNVRAEPTTNAEIVEALQYGDPITVSAWVKGEEVFEGADEWAHVGPNRFIYARNVGRNAPVLPPPLPADAPAAGKWIDVHLTQQLLTAYDGREVVRVCVTTTGMAGWETPPGFYAINTRVANETMTSGAIGAEHFYKLEDVLFTQYFTDRGHAIHFAWWRTPETIGRPGSHGCLNLLLDDSRFIWDWATVGTPVVVRQI